MLMVQTACHTAQKGKVKKTQNTEVRKRKYKSEKKGRLAVPSVLLTHNYAL